MAQLEEGIIEFGENIEIKNEEFIDLNFEDDEALKDLKFEIPLESRIYTYYGCSQSEENWEGNKLCDFSVQHYDLVRYLKEPFKYMSSKTISSVDAVNDYLDDFVDNIKSSCQSLKENEMLEEDLKLMVQDLAENETTLFDKKTAVETFYIGRIRFGYHNKRLTSRNICLEACISRGNGLVVPIDLSLLKSNIEDESIHNVSIFPGQVVVVKAQNPFGSYLRVSKFYPIGQLISPEFPLKCSRILSSNIAFQMVVASGPFVSLDDYNIDPINTRHIRALADYVRSHNPNVLFLCGPFFDIDHIDEITKWSIKQITVENGTFPYQWSIEKLFHNQMRAFMKHLEGQHLGTKICFIPSPNELGQNNIYPTFPQEILSTIQIQSFPSPSFLNVDDIAVAINTADILLHMSRFEISNIQKANSDRLKRLCSHILDHKNFYPIYPPDSSLNLETSLYGKLSMPVNPHVLILPSVLRPFAFEVDKTVVVNPGRVSKNTIARIKIDPVDPSAFNGHLSDYTNVEIIKLIQ